MVVRTYSVVANGVGGVPITIEAARERALPTIHITGLPGEVIRESRERVRVCLGNLGFDIPSARLVVHLSPASSKKQGSQFDLPIALAILAAEGRIPVESIQSIASLGELMMDGRVKAVEGIVGMLETLSTDDRLKTILVPAENARDAVLLEDPRVRTVDSVAEVIDALGGKKEFTRLSEAVLGSTESESVLPDSDASLIDEVIGQAVAKRALEVALAGRHHLLLMGPPGVGKSLLASCIPSLLPPLVGREIVEVTKCYGSVGLTRPPSNARPFRSPHHSISAAGLLGGGTKVIQPGEVTLAHRGVLFLDELPEYQRDAIEGLREPLSDQRIRIGRVGRSLEFPASFQLVVAMNPCPCGNSLSSRRDCLCPVERVRRYRQKISGPLLDRIDLGVVMQLEPQAVATQNESEAMRARIAGVRMLQGERKHPLEMESRARLVLDRWLTHHMLSKRAVNSIGRVAQTLADLEGGERVQSHHIEEACMLRCPRMEAW